MGFDLMLKHFIVYVPRTKLVCSWNSDVFAVVLQWLKSDLEENAHKSEHVEAPDDFVRLLKTGPVSTLSRLMSLVFIVFLATCVKNT